MCIQCARYQRDVPIYDPQGPACRFVLVAVSWLMHTIDSTILDRHLLTQVASTHGGNILWSGRGEHRTYLEVAAIVRARCTQLQNAGVRGRVPITLPNSAEFLYTFFAMLEAGIVPVLLNPGLTAPERHAIRVDSSASWAVESSGSASVVRALDRAGAVLREFPLAMSQEGCLLPGPYSVDPSGQADSEAVMFYTSGSTGRMKGVVHTVSSLLSNAALVARAVGIQSTDRHLLAVPFFHSFGFTFGVLSAVASGAAIVNPENVGALGLLEQVERHSVSVLVCGVSLLRQLVVLARTQRPNLSSLRLVAVGGSALPPNVAAEAMETICPLVLNLYGTSETGGVAVGLPSDPREKVGTVGRPLPGIELRIVNDERQPVECGSLGEIACRTDGCFREYLNMEDATHRAKDEAGWYYTGDVGHLDQDGYLSITGRKDDVIAKSGFKIYPKEIDLVLSALPQVAECVVVGVPDVRLGQRIRAVVQAAPSSGLSVRELRTACAERVIYYKVPDEIILVDALPRTPTGKVDMRLIRSTEWPAPGMAS